MAEYEDREAFIPYRRADIIDICIEDGQLAPAEIQKFRDFCEILSAYYHFHFHQSLEMLKDNFAPFNPDVETKLRIKHTPAELVQMGNKFVSAFETILEKANYIPLSAEFLQHAVKEQSLIEIHTDVNFDDFEQLFCFYRGDSYETISVKKFFFWEEEQRIKTFERVVLLLKFKDAAYFANKKVKNKKLKFTPSKMYVYLYKNIPQQDIQLLFPNIKFSMTLKDRLFFGVPAIGGALLIITKALFLAFGGFAFKQYTNYKNKRIKFQKKVTDTLFFRNLDSNAGVFQALIDAAEEEVCKEIILVYYHLLTNKDCLTPKQLDDRIEEWMEEKFDTKIDFDINSPLHNLETIRGISVKASPGPESPKEGGDDKQAALVPLLTYDSQGCCRVLPLDDAKRVLDYVWDNVFLYANDLS